MVNKLEDATPGMTEHAKSVLETDAVPVQFGPGMWFLRDSDAQGVIGSLQYRSREEALSWLTVETLKASLANKGGSAAALSRLIDVHESISEVDWLKEAAGQSSY